MSEFVSRDNSPAIRDPRSAIRVLAPAGVGAAGGAWLLRERWEPACEDTTCEDWLIEKALTFVTVEPKLAKCDLAHVAMLKACHGSCHHCLVAHTACAQPGPLFSCQAAHGEMRTWGEAQLSWCCHNRGVGCGLHQSMPKPYDCMAGGFQLWSEAKQSWCCAEENRGCKYDCHQQLNTWQHTWSLKKRAWCCEKEKLGCIKPNSFDCTEGALTAAHWSQVKRHYCCHMEGVGCQADAPKPLPSPETGYSCTGRHWPLEKAKWCCLNRKVGCKLLSSTSTTTPMPELFDCKAGVRNWEEGWSHRKKVWCCREKHLGCSFDCRDNLQTWQVSWSASQKTFCCAMFRLGCVTLGQLPLPPQPKPGHWDCERHGDWSLPQQEWCCRNRGVGCDVHHVHVSHSFHVHVVHVDAPPHLHLDAPHVHFHVDAPHEPFHSQEGFNFDCTTDSTLWPPKQRRLCCRDYQVGCSGAEHFHEVHHLDGFDCHSGEPADWSQQQRQICCLQGIGCGVQSIVTDEHEHFQCDSYDETWEQWSQKQKRLCCSDYGIGCTGWRALHRDDSDRPRSQVPAPPPVVAAGTFDCNSGELADLWPVKKRAWCCRFESKGCSDARSPRYDCRPDTGAAWSKEHSRWCCEVKNVGCGAMPLRYDCASKVDEWHQAWSADKKRFCCDHVKVGCPKDRPWLDALLQPEARRPSPQSAHAVHSAANHESSSPSFDCKTGVEHWKEGWSAKKSRWCCAHYGFGCPFDCGSPNRTAWDRARSQWCCEHQQAGCDLAAKFLLQHVDLDRGSNTFSLSLVACAFLALALWVLRVTRAPREARCSELLE
ncbi:unnamed protein product [Effrenium voratum]|nr:unnamed protein product [Effrenium voratum]